MYLYAITHSYIIIFYGWQGLLLLAMIIEDTYSSDICISKNWLCHLFSIHVYLLIINIFLFDVCITKTHVSLLKLRT